ncbi:hypothetical protein TKK_0010012 [Trichogramma kaykai]
MDISHRKGAFHKVPDYLSRSIDEIAAIKSKDPIEDLWYAKLLREVELKPDKYPDYRIDNNLLYIHRPKSLKDPLLPDLNSWKLVVPAENRKTVLHDMHNTPQAGHLDQDHSTWDVYVKELTFAFNTAFGTSTGFSPAYLNFGRNPRTIVTIRNELENAPCSLESLTPEMWADRMSRLPAIYDFVRKNLATANEKQTRYYNANRKAISFEINDLVVRKNHTLSSKVDKRAKKLDPKYRSSKIIKKISPVIYMVKDEDNRETQVHVNDLKPYQPELYDSRQSQPKSKNENSSDTKKVKTRKKQIDNTVDTTSQAENLTVHNETDCEESNIKHRLRRRQTNSTKKSK